MKVSTYIPTYNNARFLPECLDSILSQGFQDLEIVVADDGSQDSSNEILLDYQSRYPNKIRYLFHPGHGHKGFAATCNLALRELNGEYIARNDSDDIWYPEKLEQQISILENHPESGLVYSYAQYVDRSGRELPGCFGVDVTTDENPLGRMLIAQNVPENTVVIRRKVLDQIGLYDEAVVYSDADMMIRIFSHWKAIFVNQPLAKYRIHNANMSKGIDPKEDLRRRLAVFHGLEQKSSTIGGALLISRNQAILDLQLALLTFCEGNQQGAIFYLHRAFQRDPSLIGDVEFLNTWMNQWKPDCYTISNNHFGLWVISHLPTTATPGVRNQLAEMQLSIPETKTFFIQHGIKRYQAQAESADPANLFNDYPDTTLFPKSWKEQVMKEIYPALLFDSFKMGDLSKTRYYWRQTVQLDPSWLKNRGVWSIGLKALLGNRN